MIDAYETTVTVSIDVDVVATYEHEPPSHEHPNGYLAVRKVRRLSSIDDVIAEVDLAVANSEDVVEGAIYDHG